MYLRDSSPADSSNWKLVISYDGTDFDGWQVQPGRKTVQGELADALKRIVGERVLPQGSGRTDAGVHALAQVASFRLAAPIPPENLRRALNRILPSSIRVHSAEPAPAEFHARHSAIGKTYEYRILRCQICSPWLARYVYGFSAPLDVEAMQRAALLVVGEHDFTSFKASDPDRARRHKTGEEETRGGEAGSGEAAGAPLESPLESPTANVRVVYESGWRVEDGGELLIYRVKGSGFLHHMVRNLAGTFLDVGRGLTTAEAVPAILAARSRSSAGRTAPARGLFLVSVDYGG